LHRCPGVLDSAPRETDEEDSHAAQEQHRADPVGLPELLSESELGYCIQPDEAESENEPQKDERKVDVETPSPCRVLTEGTSNHWPDDGSYSPSPQYDGEVLGSEPQRHDVAEDDLAKCDDTTTADTLDASSYEHHCEVIRDGTKYCSDHEE
jgi:hypothetical protein